ncbi:TetR/AcrR family transcriptional regulator [soil metagenome]
MTAIAGPDIGNLDTMPELPELHAPKAARILAAAAELLVSRGFKGVTMSEVAQRAYVGKGTVYLYWATKEDLLLGLIGREFLAFADYLVEQLTADPQLARPSRFCRTVLRFSADRPLMAALHDHDDGLLGVLAQDPRSYELYDALGPVAVLHSVLPAWRRAALARSDWPLAEQALAMHIVTAGAATVLTQPQTTSAGPDILEIYTATVTEVLGPEQGSADQVGDAAREIIGSLTEKRAFALRLISSHD